MFSLINAAFGNFNFISRNLFCHFQAPFNIHFKSFQVAVVDTHQFSFIANMIQFLFIMNLQQYFQTDFLAQ